VRNAVEWMVRDANRASEVIQRVRGLLKKADTQKVPVNVNDAIDEVAALLRRELAAHEVSLQQQLAPARLVVNADPVQLQQVLINLVMNAVEAMQGIVGRPRTLAVRSYEDEARQIVVSVSDNGPGIPGEMADRVFDAFFSTKPAGLGMGLSICRSIIEDHSGQLRATTHQDGPGATFHFTLPAYLEAA
jgi:C4-dicarboxylate-specific signal transduction histidine kinase